MSNKLHAKNKDGYTNSINISNCKTLSSIAFIAATISIILVFVAESMATGSLWSEKILKLSMIAFPIAGFSSGILILIYNRFHKLPSRIIRRGWTSVVISIAVLFFYFLAVN